MKIRGVFFSFSKARLEFPESTEILSLYYAYAQLSNQTILSLTDIEKGLIRLNKFQNYSNIDLIIDLIAFQYNILDKNDKDFLGSINKGKRKLFHIINEFYGIYFDYLIEIGEHKKLSYEIKEIEKIINGINKQYLNNE